MMHRLMPFIFILLTESCGIYSFTGVNVSPEIKTVSVDYFPNKAAQVQPVLSQSFTEALKDIFITQSNLSLVSNGGDIQFAGEITGYSVQPVAIQGNETAAMNRLIIVVNVRFTNTVEEKESFEASFSRFSDFESSQNLSNIEQELISQINTQLVQDIFDKVMINW